MKKACKFHMLSLFTVLILTLLDDKDINKNKKKMNWSIFDLKNKQRERCNLKEVKFYPISLFKFHPVFLKTP